MASPTPWPGSPLRRIVLPSTASPTLAWPEHLLAFHVLSPLFESASFVHLHGAAPFLFQGAITKMGRDLFRAGAHEFHGGIIIRPQSRRVQMARRALIYGHKDY